MSPDGDQDIGTYVFEDAIIHDDLRGKSAILYAYGIYLANGGTPEGFMSLSYTDIQIMLIAYTGTKKKELIDLSKMIAGMFGSEDDG